MLYEAIVGLFVKTIDLLSKWLGENLIAHVMTFSKEFGALIVFVSAVVFLLITVYFIMKQAKRLPRRYELDAFDQDGNLRVVSELRTSFMTYQAAASFAEYYTKLYEEKYRFKVRGIRDNITILRRFPSRNK